MDKALRNTIIAGIIVITLSVGYYLVVFLPHKEKARADQQNQEQIAGKTKEKEDEFKQKQDKCLLNAETIKNKIEKENNEFPLVFYAIFMDIFYSQSADKCLYVVQESYMSPKTQAQIYTKVKDALTDSELASFKRNEDEEKLQKLISVLKSSNLK